MMKKIFYTHSTKNSRQSGFTLLEMIVASSIFIIVMLVVVGALISLNNESRKARATRLVLDNLSSAIDSISRDARMGTYYHCGCPEVGTAPIADAKNCPMDTSGSGGDQCFAFEGQHGDPHNWQDQHVYRLHNNRIQRSKQAGQSISTPDDTFLDITAPEIKVTSLQFFVAGSAPDTNQPEVTMLIRGVVKISEALSSDFNMQTTLASRSPNYSTLP